MEQTDERTAALLDDPTLVTGRSKLISNMIHVICVEYNTVFTYIL